jgi:glycosyltransferase involved in cell wall biosynthesis
MIKVFSLHAKFSSFFATCFGELATKHDAKIRMVCVRPHAEAPFDESIYDAANLEKRWFKDEVDISMILREIEAFQPDVILVSGWFMPEYLQVCKWFRQQGGLVVAYSDTQYYGSLRQRIGCLLSRWRLQPAIDVVWVAGERQRAYARRLGFATSQIWEPMLCCDVARFAKARKASDQRARSFLFVGRFVHDKGIDLLCQAYQRYRESVADPWSLKLIGAGSGIDANQPMDGVEVIGFVQPEEIPEAMADASCFVLPSRFEPWGVVVQEAAALGLPLITSDACGASVHLLRDGWNGYLIDTNHVNALTESMLRIHQLPNSRLSQMGERSAILSEQFTPDRWAQTLIDGVRVRKQELASEL